jgi:osmotically-inducible protein OsmY
VDNLLVDLPSGRLVAVVLSSGGFLGMGDELSAVPPTALRFSADRASLQLDATKEKLSSAPHFKANQWPDFAQPEQAGGVYRAYQVEPYFATDATTDADNTRRNARDRNDKTLTPLDQGNSPADIRTTASIRKEIGAADNMSVNARNVKIITKDGRVTLRGPVNSAEEKRLIGEIANRIARAANVDNQLEVKLTTSGN